MENKISFSDIVALAKQGYKPSDIKELLNMSIPTAEGPGEAEQKTEEAPQKVDAEEQKEEVNASAESKPDAIDHKEEEAEEVKRLKKELAEAQKVNASKDISGKAEQSDADIIKDLARSLM